MRSIFLFILYIFGVAVSGCDSSPDRMFRLHVLDPIPKEVIASIGYLKGNSAMHGAMFFHFKVSDSVVPIILEKHKLKRVSTMPNVMETLNKLARKQADWWRPSTTMDKYAVWYDPKSGIGDWHARCLYIDGENAYFMTTGFFDEQIYTAMAAPN